MLQEHRLLFYPEYMWLQELKFAIDREHYIKQHLFRMLRQTDYSFFNLSCSFYKTITFSSGNISEQKDFNSQNMRKSS